ncbi:dipeptidyl peptidase 2 [Caerostris extrusa]|uniref:Dipeptidyl peptidase 2 n=1 Tax=Caerostris extrusa TaxID=172846 RepID=A0AAV4N274_CAEEX|nr:dipeptidyl peptidase 2 [Caerostris extrusa]
MHALYAVISCLFLVGISSAVHYEYTEEYFDQKIDHFNFIAHGNETYKQRYLYNTTWWDKGEGPIFFYAGNEGDITGFWENTGFIFKAAKAFNALVLFAEHRYYGKSLPFGNDSFSNGNLGLLSVSQAISDYAFLLKNFKETHGAEKCPVIAFGGSYGGQLAAYMRFKYPNIIHGAIVSSTPFYQVAGETSGDIFFQKVTKDFSDVSPKCELRVRSAFSQLDKWAASGRRGYSQITRNFHLCNTLKSNKDYDHFLRWARNAFALAAMVDYPYPATFMGNFPAFPVRAMCKLLQSAPRPVGGLREAVALYYNSTGTLKCFDIYEEYIYCADPTGCGLGFDATAWDYQVCTELNIIGSTYGVDDMFPVLPFTSKMRDEYCYKTYKVLPREDYLDVQYWGTDISSSSNIIQKNISDSLVAVIIDGGAHHLDLREDNPDDPPSVRDARDFELRNINKWLEEYYTK